MVEPQTLDLKSRMAVFTKAPKGIAPSSKDTAAATHGIAPAPKDTTPKDTTPNDKAPATPGDRASEAPSTGGPDGEEPAGRHARLSCEVPAELLDAARNAVVALSPTGLTLAALVAEGLGKELLRLEQEHNQGEPFPARRRRELQRGRRIA